MCKYCEQVTHQNFAGKRFFAPLPSNFGGDNICLSINTYDRYAIHYEDVHKTTSDVVSAPINFCPICGRKLMESNIAPKLKELAENHFDTEDTDECYDAPAIGGYYE